MWISDWERTASKHQHCGHQRSVCSDPNRVWYPQRTVCYVSMEEKSAERRYAEIHEERPFHNGDFTRWAKEPSPAHPYHHNDGVEIFVAEVDIHPDDDFLAPPDLFEQLDRSDGGDPLGDSP